MSPQHKQLQLLFQLYILSQHLVLDRENISRIFLMYLTNLLDNTVAVMLEERLLSNIRVDRARSIVGSLPDVSVKIKELCLVVTAVASLTKAV